jgi:(p)ppGpp synthase/HD superfamily hydrolase
LENQELRNMLQASKKSMETLENNQLTILSMMVTIFTPFGTFTALPVLSTYIKYNDKTKGLSVTNIL